MRIGQRVPFKRIIGRGGGGGGAYVEADASPDTSRGEDATQESSGNGSRVADQDGVSGDYDAGARNKKDRPLVGAVREVGDPEKRTARFVSQKDDSKTALTHSRQVESGGPEVDGSGDELREQSVVAETCHTTALVSKQPRTSKSSRLGVPLMMVGRKLL